MGTLTIIGTQIPGLQSRRACLGGRFIHRTVQIAILLVICCMCMFGFSQRSSGLSERELARYDSGGVINIGIAPTGDEANRLQNSVRSFLWEHFQERRLGYIKLHVISREGEPTVTTYYIEPDEQGVWYVEAVIVRTIIQRKFPHEKKSTSHHFRAYLLERLDKRTARTINDKSAHQYLLQLKDNAGVVLQTL